MKSLPLQLILALLIINSACVSDPKEFFVDGDLVEGTIMDSSGLISVDDYKSLNGYKLEHGAYFAESLSMMKRPAVRSEKKKKKVREESPEVKETRETNYSFAVEGEKYVYRDPRPEARRAPVLTFQARNGRLVMADEGIEPLHYSLKANGEAFSLLFRARDERGSFLMFVVFTKIKEQAPIRTINTQSNYFTKENGIAVPWKRAITIDVCGKNAESHKAEVEASLARWSKAGGEDFGRGFIGRQPYTVGVKTQARPFSDLNQNCVFFLERHQMKSEGNAALYGITLPIIDSFDQEIINSQTLIFQNAIAEDGVTIDYVLDHELGHALGLGHASGLLYSIMSYDSARIITWSDQETIKNLYLEDRKP